MRKNVLTKALAFALCAAAAVPTVACGGGAKGEAIDPNKTQIRVYHVTAGYGDKWVNELKENFQDLVKEVSFEEGKTGVQILISGDQTTTRNADRWRNEPVDVIFTENPEEFYAMMSTGVLDPIDDIMEAPKADDDTLLEQLTELYAMDNSQTVASKMTAQQIDAYTYEGHYYGIPHYAGHYGMIYNIDLFEEKGLYLAAEPDEETGDILISDTNPVKGLGPDGRTGVIDGVDYSADDGLPRTYDEFFDLMFEINQKSIDPICWSGHWKNTYTTMPVEALVANHMGAEQMNLNYTFDSSKTASGMAEELVVFDAQGNIVWEDEAAGIPMTESVVITEDNGYELSRQVGKYYAFKFYEKLFSTADHFNEADGFGGTSHTEMEQKFLENGKRGIRQNAILLDGVWWQMEADPVFESMTKDDEKWSKENRRFGWMPMPHATEEQAEKFANGEQNTVFLDFLNAVACLKAGLPEGTKNAAKALLRYAYTDKALTDFTYTTGTTIGVDYLDAVDYSKLTHYETTLLNYIKKSDYVCEVSSARVYNSNMKTLHGGSAWYGSANYFYEAFYSGDDTAEDYFKAHQVTYKGIAWVN